MATIDRILLQRSSEEVKLIIKKELTTELTKQGHILTGSLRDSIETKSTAFAKGIILSTFFNSYGEPINTGVPGPRIPYTPNSGKKNSKYIAGLVDFVKKRRIETNDKKALGVAFAIARTQKKQGQPTKGSFKFSKNKRRSGWVDFALINIEKQVIKKIQDVWAVGIETSIINTVKRTQ